MTANANLTNLEQETIYFAQPAPDIAVIRVEGRGTHQNSPAFQSVTNRLIAENPQTRFIVDLESCPTMDSTFLGALASVAIRQIKSGAGKTAVINGCEQATRLLEVLGLRHVLDIRCGDPGERVDEEAFEPAEAPQLSKLERAIHMIQAHEQLVDLDSSNEVRFEGVLQYLRQSAERERGKQEKS